jgi:hypothetical protein
VEPGESAAILNSIVPPAQPAQEGRLHMLVGDGRTPAPFGAAFVPRPKGDVDSVELAGQYAPQGRKIRLTRAVHARIDQAIDGTVAATVEEHEGDLPEIDLDEYSFILRNVGEIEQIRCTFEEDLLEAAKEALDRRVRVTGTRLLDPQNS